MLDINEIKRKYKNLADYIVEVDEDGKIIFLDNDAFCNKLNELTPTKRYINVIIWLRFLLEKELIIPEQISTTRELIKRETLAQYQTSPFCRFIFGHCMGHSQHRIAIIYHWAILFSGC